MTSHQPCPRCKRLLAPIDGHTPPHRQPPPPRDYTRKAVPLTGRDAPWCPGGQPRGRIIEGPR